jgi:hypothetical protein
VAANTCSIGAAFRRANENTLRLLIRVLVNELGVGLEQQSPAIRMTQPVGECVNVNFVVQTTGGEEMCQPAVSDSMDASLFARLH